MATTGPGITPDPSSIPRKVASTCAFMDLGWRSVGEAPSVARAQQCAQQWTRNGRSLNLRSRNVMTPGAPGHHRRDVLAEVPLPLDLRAGRAVLVPQRPGLARRDDLVERPVEEPDRDVGRVGPEPVLVEPRPPLRRLQRVRRREHPDVLERVRQRRLDTGVLLALVRLPAALVEVRPEVELGVGGVEPVGREQEEPEPDLPVEPLGHLGRGRRARRPPRRRPGRAPARTPAAAHPPTSLPRRPASTRRTRPCRRPASPVAGRFVAARTMSMTVRPSDCPTT